MGPLVASFAVLLNRRVARLQDHRQLLAPLLHRLPRGPEVDQDRFSLGGPVHVLRVDVPVQDPALVNPLEACQDILHEPHSLLFRQAPALLGEVVRESLPLVVVHHQVAGPVLLEVGADVDHVRVVEPGDRSSLLHELLQAVLELVDVLRGVGLDRQRLAAPARNVAGIVLLDCHVGLEVLVAGPVGDPKAAHPEDVLDAILLAKHGAFRQGNRRARGLPPA